MYVFVFTDSSIKQQQQQQAAIFSRWEDDRFKNQNRRDPALESAGIHRPGRPINPAHPGDQPSRMGGGGKVQIEGELFSRPEEDSLKRGWDFWTSRMIGDLNANRAFESNNPNAFAMNASPVVVTLHYDCDRNV